MIGPVDVPLGFRERNDHQFRIAARLPERARTRGSAPDLTLRIATPQDRDAARSPGTQPLVLISFFGGSGKRGAIVQSVCSPHAPRSLFSFSVCRLPALVLRHIEFCLNVHGFFAGQIDIARVACLMKLQCCLSGSRRGFLHFSAQISELEIALMLVERSTDFGGDFQDFISNA